MRGLYSRGCACEVLPTTTFIPSQAHDKYFKVEVTAHAPVIIFPVSESSNQGFMMDLGSLAIQNTLLVPDQSQRRVGIDAYGIKLESFKVSRLVGRDVRGASIMSIPSTKGHCSHFVVSRERLAYSK